MASALRAHSKFKQCGTLSPLSWPATNARRLRTGVKRYPSIVMNAVFDGFRFALPSYKTRLRILAARRSRVLEGTRLSLRPAADEGLSPCASMLKTA